MGSKQIGKSSSVDQRLLPEAIFWYFFVSARWSAADVMVPEERHENGVISFKTMTEMKLTCLCVCLPLVLSMGFAKSKASTSESPRTRPRSIYRFRLCFNFVQFTIAWASFLLTASPCANSHPVLTNKVSRCCSWLTAIPRRQCELFESKYFTESQSYRK